MIIDIKRIEVTVYISRYSTNELIEINHFGPLETTFLDQNRANGRLTSKELQEIDYLYHSPEEARVVVTAYYSKPNYYVTVETFRDAVNLLNTLEEARRNFWRRKSYYLDIEEFVNEDVTFPANFR